MNVILQIMGWTLTALLLLPIVLIGWSIIKHLTAPSKRDRFKLGVEISNALLRTRELFTLPTKLWTRWTLWTEYVRSRSGVIRLANIAEGRHSTGNLSKKADAVIATRYLLVKFGTDVDHIALAGAADIPLGVCTDLAEAIEDPVNVHLLGSAPGTQFMVASAAIALGDFLQPAANGQVATLTAAAGTHYNVGRALNAAGAQGDLVEVDCTLQKIISP